MTKRIVRKLTTILAADAERFSAAMTADELGTFAQLQAARDVFFKLIAHHGGRVANTAGDGLIADFPSVVEAVQCAISVQQELTSRQGDAQATPRRRSDAALAFRIGIHLGDVICDGDDLIGEGVNLAARLQSMAEPGGILISQQVYDHVRNKLTIGFDYLGERRPRNLSEDVAIYRVSMGAEARGAAAAPLRADGVETTGDRLGHTEAEAAQPPLRKSQSARVWQEADPFEGAPYSSLAAPFPRPPTDPRPDADWQAHRGATRFDRTSRTLGTVAVGLVLIDILTDRGVWAHWPVLVLLTLIALREVPRRLGRRRLYAMPVRIWIFCAFLVLVNLFSQTPPWSLWVLAGVGGLAFLRRRRAAS